MQHQRPSAMLTGALPIVLDAMGGDAAPDVTVRGALLAVKRAGISVRLVGQRQVIQPMLDQLPSSDRAALDFLDAPDVIRMDEEPIAAVRRPGNSIRVGITQLRDGAGAAFVSAGHSGAIVAAAVLELGRLPGVDRPALAIPFPTVDGRWVLVLDAGATVDPRPEWLVHYAWLAQAYLRVTQGIQHPRIGLISNGEEPGKGSRLVREVYARLRETPGLTFVGNIEPHQLPQGKVDIALCDGFTGNILLKTGEGAAWLVRETVQRAFRAHWYTALLGALVRPVLRQALQRLDYRAYGAVPLLGVDGLVFIAHGRSDADAIAQAVLRAYQAAHAGLLAALRTALSERESIPRSE